MSILTSVFVYLVVFALATIALMVMDKFDLTTVAIFFIAALVSSLTTGIIDTLSNKKKKPAQKKQEIEFLK